MAKDRKARPHRKPPGAETNLTNDQPAQAHEAPARGKRTGSGPVSLPDPAAVAAEEANEGVGLSGSGFGRSGSLPSSVGGTTGVGGQNAGLTSPGATAPDFPGMSPEEFERLRRRGAARREGGGDTGEESSS